MPIQVSINSGSDFEPLSEGVHAAVLGAILDEGMKETGFGPKHKVRFIWLTDEADEDGRTRYAMQFFSAGNKPDEVRMHPKSGLYKAVKAIIKKDPPEGFDLESLIGTQKQLIIQHNEAANGKVYANVTAIIDQKPGNTRVTIPSDFDASKFAKKSETPAVAPARTTEVAQVKAAGGGRAVAAAAYRPAPAQTTQVTDEDLPF